jgi:hypothetical protein
VRRWRDDAVYRLLVKCDDAMIDAFVRIETFPKLAARRSPLLLSFGDRHPPTDFLRARHGPTVFLARLEFRADVELFHRSQLRARFRGFRGGEVQTANEGWGRESASFEGEAKKYGFGSFAVPSGRTSPRRPTASGRSARRRWCSPPGRGRRTWQARAQPSSCSRASPTRTEAA